MQNYYRIMMGKGGKYINEAKSENYMELNVRKAIKKKNTKYKI